MLDPYNAVMSLPDLVGNCDLAVTLDNEAQHPKP